MSETFSSMFQRTRGAPIEVNGRLILPIFKESVEQKGKSFLIARIKARASPVQGLCIKAVNGKIEVNGLSLAEIILWADTSPPQVNISVSSKSGCELKFWNVWRVSDLTQAWVGNSGISVTRASGIITLECSDGVGEPDFTDLVVQIQECN